MREGELCLSIIDIFIAVNQYVLYRYSINRGVSKMPKQDQLFTITHWLLKAATGFSIFVIAVLIFTLGGLFVGATDIGGNHLGIPVELAGVDRSTACGIVAFAVLCGLVCAALVFFVLRATAEIIQTAISGDPFVNENAIRLIRIGWLLLGVEVVGLLAHPIFERLVVQFVPENSRDQANFNLGFGMSPIGLLAVLLIFVLAQIFRRGSEMRAELEGTV
jgi:Protein of unknown function (DUF2975)